MGRHVKAESLIRQSNACKMRLLGMSYKQISEVYKVSRTSVLWYIRHSCYLCDEQNNGTYPFRNIHTVEIAWLCRTCSMKIISSAMHHEDIVTRSGTDWMKLLRVIINFKRVNKIGDNNAREEERTRDL